MITSPLPQPQSLAGAPQPQSLAAAPQSLAQPPQAGSQAGASQQVGAGSQHVGAGSQHSAFLHRRAFRRASRPWRPPQSQSFTTGAGSQHLARARPPQRLNRPAEAS